MKTVFFGVCLSAIMTGASFAQRLQPGDLEYIGAFRLPDSPGMPENVGWEWSSWSSGLTYFPDGDPSGPNDGHPGSLFGVGHDHTQYVSEISIPVPVVSATKDVNELNTAETLQGFQDIRGDLYPNLAFEIPRAGLAYLPPQGQQTGGKLYFCWSQHLQEGVRNRRRQSHICDLTFLKSQFQLGRLILGHKICHDLAELIGAVDLDICRHTIRKIVVC